MLLSVILPVHKDTGYLAESIQSILDQDYSDFELVIIANNSDAETIKVIKNFSDDRIRVHEIQIGQTSHAANFGIEISAGCYVARMDADDVSFANRLSSQMRYIEKNPFVDVLGSEYQYIDIFGCYISKPKIKFHTNAEIRNNLFYQSCIPNPTTLIRKDALIKCGGFAYGSYAEDWDLWLRMRRHGFHMEILRETLLSYRLHNEQSTSLKNFRRNVACVVGLLTREFIITLDTRFLIGAFNHLAKTSIYYVRFNLRTYFEYFRKY